MANRTVSFRLPEWMIQQLETRSKATGESKTKIIRDSLQITLGEAEPQSRFEKIERELETLKAKLELAIAK